MAVPSHPSARTIPARALHVCTTCGSKLVQCETWSHPEAERWVIGLRCPECFRMDTDGFLRPEVTAFLDHIERVTTAMRVLADQLDREAFEEQAEAIIYALAEGGIQPMDF
jgi:hypothetical protein